MATKIATKKTTPMAFDDFTTAEKVGAGVGLLVLTGGLGYGVYRLGRRFGWWGTTAVQVPVDQQPQQASRTTRPASTTSTASSGASRTSGTPPNLSGNKAGYNELMFPNPASVRAAMTGLGYSAATPFVTFQKNWNAAVRAIAASDAAYWAWLEDQSLFGAVRGSLSEDDVPGPLTLRALEIASLNQTKNKVTWLSLVGQP